MDTTEKRLLPGFSKILHGGDYNPDQWLATPDVIEEDFRLMRKAGCNTFSVGIFAWTKYEPSEGVFTFEWMDRIMDRMAEEGHKVFLATPSGAKPAWMAKKYPEIRRVTRNGCREPYQSRHNHCWQSPVYREKVKEINTRLAQRYGRHPALAAWHVSNELEGDCFCPLCLGAWHRWLKDRYGSIEALNAAWWSAFWNHEYTAWDEIDPRDHTLDGLALDWRRFNTRQLCDFIDWEAAPLREHSPDIPVTTNFMNLIPRTDYAEVAKHVDFVCDDQYPGYDAESDDLLERVVRTSFKSDLFRSFKGAETPWLIMECAPDWVQWAEHYRFKRPGIHRAEMLQALGHGAEGTLYFQWRKGRGGFEKFHSAVVDHVGHADTRVFRTVEQLGGLYEKLTPVLGSRNRPECAVIYDWEVLWAFEASCGMPRDDAYYLKTCLAHYRPLWEAGQGVDVIGSHADLTPYRILIAPQLFMLLPGVAEKLKDFVSGGGKLVMTYNSALCNETNLCFTGGWPGDGLMDVFGVWNEEGEALKPGMKRSIRTTGLWRGKQGPFESINYSAVIHSKGADVMAEYGDGFYEGLPCVTRNAFGKGEAYYLATDFEAEFLDEFYASILEDAGLKPPLGERLARGVAVQVREKAQTRFIFLQNFTASTCRIRLASRKLKCLETMSVLTEELVLEPWQSGVYEDCFGS